MRVHRPFPSLSPSFPTFSANFSKRTSRSPFLLKNRKLYKEFVPFNVNNVSNMTLFSRNFATEDKQPNPMRIRQPLAMKRRIAVKERTKTLESQVVPTGQETTTPVEVPGGLEGVLGQNSIIVTRAMEWGSILIGFEQANKYTLTNEHGQVVGYLAEESSTLSTVTRQLLRTHRGFKATILDSKGNIVLTIRRPPYLMSSSLFVESEDGTPIGEVQMRWHLWKRRYDLYKGKEQFAHIDGGFLEWDFNLQDENGKKIASVNKDFRGFAKEIFTDANQYVVHNETAERPTTLEERAVTLATAVAVDYDYFSKKSGGGWFPWIIPLPTPIPPEAPPTTATPDSTDSNVPEGESPEGQFPEGEAPSGGEGGEYWTFEENSPVNSAWKAIKDLFDD